MATIDGQCPWIWITSKQLCETLKLPSGSAWKALLKPPQTKRSCCRLELVQGQGVGQGIIAYYKDICKLVFFTNHHLIPSKASVTEWKLSVGEITRHQLCKENFSTCISCCGPDGILGTSKFEHPKQESLCQFNADFTALVVSPEFTKEIVKSNLCFPVVTSTDIEMLNVANSHERLYLMRHEEVNPVQLNNKQENMRLSRDLLLSRQVNVYKQLCQLRYQAGSVGAGDSGGGVFFHVDERSEYILVGLHKSTEKGVNQERTDLHSAVAIHLVLHAVSSKFQVLIHCVPHPAYCCYGQSY